MRIMMLCLTLLVLTSHGSTRDISIDPAELAVFIDGVMTEQL